MRQNIRIQPYLSPDLFQKLRACAAARSQTVTALVTAALGEYLERDRVEDALLVRRLDGVTRAIGQLQRDIDTLAVGFGRFVRFSLFSAPDEVKPEAIRRAESLYSEFLARIHEQLREGVKFTGMVWRARGKVSSASPAQAAGNGSRQGEGQP